MHTSSRQKYKELMKQVVNWPVYFHFKFFGKGKTTVFKLRKSASQVMVPFSMLRVFKEIFMQNEYDYQFVLTHLKPGTMVLDVGANIGLFSAWIANHFPAQKILAFEPFAGNHEHLSANVQAINGDDEHCKIIKKALTGTTSHSVDFFIDKPDTHSDSASCIPGFFNNKNKVSVPAISLNEIIHNTTERIGLLKLDCEGSEYDILYNTDPQHFERIDCMIIETHDLDLEEKNISCVLRFLQKMGFQHSQKRVDEGLHLVWAYPK